MSAEAVSTFGSVDQLATDMNKVHDLGIAILNSLQMTARRGQPVLGEVLTSKNPLAAIKQMIQEMAKSTATPKAREVLPNGVVRGIVTNRVVGGWLVKPADENGKNFTLLDESISGRLQAGDEILVTLTKEVNEHGRMVVTLFKQNQPQAQAA